jgi:hypothetical protein
MKKINWYSIAIAAGVLMTLCFGTASAEQEPVEVQKEQMFDTSIIEAQWCGGFENGTVRMMGAWWYADGVVEDEMGQLWSIEQNIEETDFLLLWIADNHTPNDMIDDIVIKVWREAY